MYQGVEARNASRGIRFTLAIWNGINSLEARFP